MDNNSKIYIAGHKGMVGSALVRRLEQEGFDNLITCSLDELDLLDQAATRAFFESEKPDYVLLAAAKVGGIMANNTWRGQFIYENLQIEANVIHSAYLSGVKKLLFLGSSCIYPKLAPQPIREEYLLTGLLESTNEPYAIAKIAGIKLCQAYHMQYGCNFISAMPTNLYGPNDNFDLETSHVLPALIRRFHEARVNRLPHVEIWGTGAPLREFLHVDDLADACFHLMENYDSPEIINIGVGQDLTIRELAELIKAVVGYTGMVKFDSSKPDGTPRKLLDVSRLHATGWRPKIRLEEGIRRTYNWFVEEWTQQHPEGH